MNNFSIFNTQFLGGGGVEEYIYNETYRVIDKEGQKLQGYYAT